MAKPFLKTVSKFESVQGLGTARPIWALALNGAKMNQMSGRAKTTPRRAAMAEKPARERRMPRERLMPRSPSARGARA